MISRFPPSMVPQPTSEKCDGVFPTRSGTCFSNGGVCRRLKSTRAGAGPLTNVRARRFMRQARIGYKLRTAEEHMMRSNRLRPLLALLALIVPNRFVARVEPAISLTVDATEAPRKILHNRLLMRVRPGPLTLYYPKWIPGEHGPFGPVGNV